MGLESTEQRRINFDTVAMYFYMFIHTFYSLIAPLDYSPPQNVIHERAPAVMGPHCTADHVRLARISWQVADCMSTFLIGLIGAEIHETDTSMTTSELSKTPPSL